MLCLFDIDVHRVVGELPEDFFESRHPHALALVGISSSAIQGKAITRVEALNLAERHVAHKTLAVRSAVHGVVMYNNDAPVGGHVDVKLETTSPTLGPQAEGLQSILWRS